MHRAAVLLTLMLLSCARSVAPARIRATVSPDALRMSWRSHGTDNKSMVAALVKNKIIKTESVAKAMTLVDRGDFCESKEPYMDRPQPIGYSATVSAPHMHAFALENLAGHLVEGAKVLDVGSGSGILACCMAHMVGTTGKVVGIEHIPELVALGIANSKKHQSELLESERLLLLQADGFDGAPDHAPYNAIHVGAAAPKLPAALVKQLAPGGRMFIPVGPEHGDQYILQVDKDADGKVTQSSIMGVRYVPLTTREHQVGRR